MTTLGKRVAGVVFALSVLVTLLVLGPPGNAYRANESFAACVGAIEVSQQQLAGEGIAACAEEHCASWAPNRLELVGVWVQSRVSESRDGASCIEPPELSDIFLP